MINLDPNLLDQDKIRLTKRKKLFKLFILPIVVFALLALFFLRTGIFNIIISVTVNKDEHHLSKIATDFQLVGNIIEPYLPYYDRGYIELSEATDIEGLHLAENSFRESLKQNPPDNLLCSIYTNLSYAIELEADLNVNSENYNDALILYNQAESMLYHNNCASADETKNPSKDELAKTAKERISEKRHKVVDAANNVNNDGDDNGQDNSDQEIDDETLENLKNQQNTAEHFAEEIRYRQGASNSITDNSSFYDTRF